MFENLLSPDSLMIFLGGAVFLLPWIIMASKPVMNASLRRRLLRQNWWGVARIVGLGRDTIEKRIDLREETFELHDNKVFSISAALKADCFYLESGVPMIDYDARDFRPVSHKIISWTQGPDDVKVFSNACVSSIHAQRLAKGMMATIRAKFLNSLTALLENKFLPWIGLGVLLAIGGILFLSYMSADSSSKCVVGIGEVKAMLNTTKSLAAAGVPVIPVA